MKVQSFSRVRLLATPWTAAYQAPLSMGITQNNVLYLKSADYVINCKPHYQHLLAAVSAPISCLISTCQYVDQHLSAASLTTVSQLTSTCNPLGQRLLAA